MDNIVRRRMVNKAEAAGYVTDGLIFFLDGLDRGGQTGYWTDIIGDVQFKLYNYTEYDNGVKFDSGNTNGGYGKAGNTVLPTGWSSQTIECACSGAIAGRWLFSGYSTNRISLACGAESSGKINAAIIADGQQRARWLLPTGTKLISINNDVGVCDLQSISKGTNDSWSANNSGTILGRRSTSSSYYSYYGIIYAVRIYNRKLTADEMKQNQMADMARYGITL